MNKVKFLIIFLYLFLTACYNNPHRVKAETTAKLLSLVKAHEYKEALKYFPYGLTRQSDQADIRLLDKVSTVLNQYGLPKKKNYLYEYIRGGNKASSSTTVTIPVYQALNANDSIIEVKIMVYFGDDLGDRKVRWLSYDIDRKMEPFIPLTK